MATRPKIDLNLLESLHVLLSERNVTYAAAKLGITQPALSAQLKRLRVAFDDPLLVKAESGRGMVLTPRATQMARSLQGIIEMLNLVAGDQGELEAVKPARTFRIAANDYALDRLARDVIIKAAGGSETSRIVFVAPRYPSSVEALENGDLDLLLDTDRNIPQGLKARILIQDGFVAAHRKNHPRGAAPLSIDSYCEMKHLVVSTIRENLRGHMDEILIDIGRRREVVGVMESFATVPKILSQSDFIATLPSGIFESHGHDLDTFDLPFQCPPYTLSMAWHPRSDKDEGLKHLREILIAASGHAIGAHSQH